MQPRPGFPLILTIFAACAAPSAPDQALADAASAKAPVVVELFSSEGCSSCPPADVVLGELASSPSASGAPVIALELHVDYWNYLGWEDPFSSAAFTARQRAYADALGQRGVYTPQMIVDGATGFVGSEKRTATSAIAAAAKAPKAKVALTRAGGAGGAGDRVSVAVSELPDPSAPASVWLAITESGLRTAVRRGENAGSTLAHGPVVRSLKKLGAIAAGAPASAFTGEADVTVDPSWKRENLRAVVFVQRSKSLQIIGAASIALP